MQVLYFYDLFTLYELCRTLDDHEYPFAVAHVNIEKKFVVLMVVILHIRYGS